MAEIDVNELADEAVAAVAERLPNLAGSAADALVNLVTSRLTGSRTGTRALESLRANPSGPAEQELANAVLGDELHRDPEFAAAVARALGRPQVQQSSVTLGTRNVVKGDVAGGNIDKSKRYHIGSIRFGGGGLTALIAVAVLGAGGGGAAVYNAYRADAGPPLVQTRSGSGVAIGGTSYDFDAAELRVTAEGGDDDGDRIVDVAFGDAAVSSTGGARIAPLPAGVVPSPTTCGDALDNRAVPSISELSVADVVCVRTSRGSIAAVTISGMQAGGRVYSIDFAYFAPER